jgi:protein TonB
MAHPRTPILFALTFAAVVLAGCDTAPTAPAAAPRTLGSLNREDVFELNQLDHPPVPTSRPRPVFPFEQRRAGVSGEATIDFIVDEEGNVRNVRAITATHLNFAQAAAENVASWKFRPGVKGGRPVKTHMRAPLVFTLNER